MQVVFEGTGFNLDKIIKKVSLKCLVFRLVDAGVKDVKEMKTNLRWGVFPQPSGGNENNRVLVDGKARANNLVIGRVDTGVNDLNIQHTVTLMLTSSKGF